MELHQVVNKYQISILNLNSFLRTIVIPQNDNATINIGEVETYIQSYTKFEMKSYDETFDILKWWRNNEALYPNVSRMAKYFLAIPPASSVPSESAMSTAGRVIDDYRSFKSRYSKSADYREIMDTIKG